MPLVAKAFVALCIPLFFMNCASRQLTEEGIETCLVRTDFVGGNADLRAAIAWHIAYERKLRETTCCALQPRTDILEKRSDIAVFKRELLRRIDILETNSSGVSPHEHRVAMRKTDSCYGALMDLYHDVNRAIEHPRSR